MEEVYDDLLLILRNCREYNGTNHPIQKTADKFDQCIQTRWKNIVDLLKKKSKPFTPIHHKTWTPRIPPSM